MAGVDAPTNEPTSDVRSKATRCRRSAANCGGTRLHIDQQQPRGRREAPTGCSQAWHVSGSNRARAVPTVLLNGNTNDERGDTEMSDGYDGGHEGYDNGHVDTAHEDYDLDHNQQAYGNEHDASQNYDAYGQAHNYENDEHYNHGHAVEYDSPTGEHYAEQDYTNYDSHVAESDAAYGEH